MSWQVPLDVDVVQQRSSRLGAAQVAALVEAHLRGLAALQPGAALGGAELAAAGGALAEHVACVALCDARHAAELRPDARLRLHVHKLDAFAAERDALSGADEELDACEVRALPHEDFHGLWESLEFESSLKADLLRFTETAFALEALGVDPRQVACGRMALLHGPPGTGKTSLCRALAHKLAVRLADRFPRARLLELNAHGLFSKWFSESGKLVTKLFNRLDEIVDDPRMLAVILIDEVESLTHARRAALAGLEPSDSIRAVNAVLAALDRLRRRPNALVLATSNVTGAIDAAFVDRADIKRLVPPPGPGAAYGLLRGAAAALAAAGALQPLARGGPLFAWRVLEQARFASTPASAASLGLAEVSRAAAAAALSGRALRRLPFLALARADRSLPADAPALPEFVSALRAALERYLQDEADLEDRLEDKPAPTVTVANGH